MFGDIEKNVVWLSMLSEDERRYEIFKLYMDNPENAEMILTFATGKIKGISKDCFFARLICGDRK